MRTFYHMTRAVIGTVGRSVRYTFNPQADQADAETVTFDLYPEDEYLNGPPTFVDDELVMPANIAACLGWLNEYGKQNPTTYFEDKVAVCVASALKSSTDLRDKRDRTKYLIEKSLQAATDFNAEATRLEAELESIESQMAAAQPTGE